MTESNKYHERAQAVEIWIGHLEKSFKFFNAPENVIEIKNEIIAKGYNYVATLRAAHGNVAEILAAECAFRDYVLMVFRESKEGDIVHEVLDGCTHIFKDIFGIHEDDPIENAEYNDDEEEGIKAPVPAEDTSDPVEHDNVVKDDGIPETVNGCPDMKGNSTPEPTTLCNKSTDSKDPGKGSPNMTGRQDKAKPNNFDSESVQGTESTQARHLNTEYDVQPVNEPPHPRRTDVSPIAPGIITDPVQGTQSTLGRRPNTEYDVQPVNEPPHPRPTDVTPIAPGIITDPVQGSESTLGRRSKTNEPPPIAPHVPKENKFSALLSTSYLVIYITLVSTIIGVLKYGLPTDVQGGYECWRNPNRPVCVVAREGSQSLRLTKDAALSHAAITQALPDQCQVLYKAWKSLAGDQSSKQRLVKAKLFQELTNDMKTLSENCNRVRSELVDIGNSFHEFIGDIQPKDRTPEGLQTFYHAVASPVGYKPIASILDASENVLSKLDTYASQMLQLASVLVKEDTVQRITAEHDSYNNWYNSPHIFQGIFVFLFVVLVSRSIFKSFPFTAVIVVTTGCILLVGIIDQDQKQHESGSFHIKESSQVITDTGVKIKEHVSKVRRTQKPLLRFIETVQSEMWQNHHNDDGDLLSAGDTTVLLAAADKLEDQASDILDALTKTKSTHRANSELRSLSGTYTKSRNPVPRRYITGYLLLFFITCVLMLIVGIVPPRIKVFLLGCATVVGIVLIVIALKCWEGGFSDSCVTIW